MGALSIHLRVRECGPEKQALLGLDALGTRSESSVEPTQGTCWEIAASQSVRRVKSLTVSAATVSALLWPDEQRRVIAERHKRDGPADHAPVRPRLPRYRSRVFRLEELIRRMQALPDVWFATHQDMALHAKVQMQTR